MFKPFKLASLDLHAKQQEALQKKMEKLSTSEQEARVFRAKAWSKDMVRDWPPVSPWIHLFCCVVPVYTPHIGKEQFVLPHRVPP